MQNWTRLYQYIHDYQNLLYSFYAKHAVAFLTTYWNINKEVTIWDNRDMMGGAYERTGDLTGIRWNKYLLLPIYFPDEITSPFDGTETGLNKIQETSIVFPSEYGLTPYAGDIVKLEQQFLRPTNNTYPIFMVEGIDIHPNTDYRFWKLKLKVHHSTTTDVIDDQTEDTFVFFDYDKKIHPIEEALSLARLLEKNAELKSRLEEIYDPNTGFYMV